MLDRGGGQREREDTHSSMLPVVLATLVAVVASEGLTAPELQHAASIGQMLDIAAVSDMPAASQQVASAARKAAWASEQWWTTQPNVRLIQQALAARSQPFHRTRCVDFEGATLEECLRAADMSHWARFAATALRVR